MQVSHYQKGLLRATRTLYTTEGVLGFYRGFQATLQRELPFAALQFPLYEWFKRRWQRALPSPGSILKPWKAAICGSLAGSITAAITTPLDVIKTRTILSKHQEELVHYASPWNAVIKLWKEGGIKRLYAGVIPRTIWISLGGFIFFGAYEKAKTILQYSSTL